jgi:hypothetical protein
LLDASNGVAKAAEGGLDRALSAKLAKFAFRLFANCPLPPLACLDPLHLLICL